MSKPVTKPEPIRPREETTVSKFDLPIEITGGFTEEQEAAHYDAIAAERERLDPCTFCGDCESDPCRCAEDAADMAARLAEPDIAIDLDALLSRGTGADPNRSRPGPLPTFTAGYTNPRNLAALFPHDPDFAHEA